MLALSLAALASTGSARAGEAAVAEIQRAAYSADYAGGIKTLTAMVKADPSDTEAVFGIGGLQVLGALAALQEGLWHHNRTAPRLRTGVNPAFSMFGGFGLLMAGSVLLPPNPAASPMTYQIFRGVLVKFVDDLDRGREIPGKGCRATWPGPAEPGPDRLRPQSQRSDRAAREICSGS
ncbi:MAG: hypothetical protein R3D67_12120 [Hyphomicrobiaceae bacterium]